MNLEKKNETKSSNTELESEPQWEMWELYVRKRFESSIILSRN